MSVKTVFKASLTLLPSIYRWASPLHPKITYIKLKSFLSDSTIAVQGLQRKNRYGGEVQLPCVFPDVLMVVAGLWLLSLQLSFFCTLLL